ncbi:DASH complex subunit dam1 [Aspergillus hancockii]|nr:DASH complex subunit dam1 [Aspergillus hancockii]
MESGAFSRSSSRPRPSSRPTTPLRPSSRTSFREAHGYGGSIGNAGYIQPAINTLEPQFAELADSMADLETNFMHLQLMHESLTRFSESFASFLYGLNMNAFCVDFPDAPIAESFRRAKQAEARKEAEVEQFRPANEGVLIPHSLKTPKVRSPLNHRPELLLLRGGAQEDLVHAVVIQLEEQAEALIEPVRAHYQGAEESGESIRSYLDIPS